MTVFQKSTSKTDRSDSSRRKRKTDKRSSLGQFLETSGSIGFLIFLLTAAGIGLLSLMSLSPTVSQVLPNQIFPLPVVSSEHFSYESEILTEREKERRVDRVPPAFDVDMADYGGFAAHIAELAARIDELEQQTQEMDAAERLAAARDLADDYNSENIIYTVNYEDILILLEETNAGDREHLFENALITLREIYLNGIYYSNAFAGEEEQDAITLFSVGRPSIETAEEGRILSEMEARRLLRINLEALTSSPDVYLALNRIFRNGIVPNLEFDGERTEMRRSQVKEAVRPVVVEVRQGQTIIEAGTRVSPERHEMYREYLRYLAESGGRALNINERVFHRILLVFGILLSAVIYIRIEDRETLKSNSRLALLGLVAFLNLGLVWFVMNLGNLPATFEENPWIAILPYLAPTALAPLIVAILIGQRPAIFMALLISFFSAIMYGYRVETFVIAFLSALVGIYFCQQIRFRGRVVKAGALSGLTVAVAAFFFGIGERLEMLTLGQQMAAGVATGSLTGIVVVGLLPILESLFRRTTDITLLELTDSNHPLLKRMQMEAPGSYHHSLVVANLSENAANAIGANPLLCRVCAMFHDIGKVIKPEYFTENQRDGVNPHLERNPSFSALIIKSHVKEGVDLAVSYKLPRLIIDVIRQHHGTTLIQYFYYRAKEKECQDVLLTSSPKGQRIELDKVSENTYRYDGPKPQFKESAIIFFADSVEAASRCLKKVTPPSIEELIDKLVGSRIEDGQLDECPLTLEEISQIKKSFSFTLLNMLHTRVEYPSGEKKQEKHDENAEKAAAGADSKPVEKTEAKTD
ncbi:MAG: HDIG domain-containing metalloprotein [Opitutales bacterium]